MYIGLLHDNATNQEEQVSEDKRSKFISHSCQFCQTRHLPTYCPSPKWFSCRTGKISFCAKIYWQYSSYDLRTIKCEFLELTKEAKLFPSRRQFCPLMLVAAWQVPAWHTPTVFVSTNLNCQLDFSFSSPTFVTICCNLISRSLTPATLLVAQDGVPASFTVSRG